MPPPSVFELSVSFTLFRRATLDEDEACEDPFRPLSDRYAEASMTEEGFRRGSAILNIHYDQPDVANIPVVRIYAFVRLLRANMVSTDTEWRRFRDTYNRCTPTLHAIAWFPLLRGEPFQSAILMRMASSAPLTIEESTAKGRIH